MSDQSDRTTDGRFKKGVCPNPKGRPRKDHSMSGAILDAANETVTVNHNGRKRRMAKARASASQIANKAATGDIRAAKILIDYSLKAEEQKAASGTTERSLIKSDQEIVELFLAEYRKSLGLEAAS